MDVATGLRVLLEAGGAVVSAVALTNTKALDPDEKRLRCEDQFCTVMERGLNKTGRVAFGLKTSGLTCLSSSVAAEEIHECYITHCAQQYAAINGFGCVYCVYGPTGTGKSMGTLSLLIMKSNFAPARAVCFGGRTLFNNGDEYYTSLLDEKIGGGKVLLSAYARNGVFSPDALASTLIDLLPLNRADFDGARVSGIGDVPGLETFLRTRGGGRGGSPVVVLDDVNISGLDPLDPLLDRQNQVAHWKHQLGMAGHFFDSLITKGYNSGIIVFVATKNLQVAQFFQLFNDFTKARTLKNVRLPLTLECQPFDWSVANRKKFLNLQNNQLKPQSRSSDTEIDIIVQDAMAARPTPVNVREMYNNFAADVSRRTVGVEFSKGSGFWDWVNCGFCR